MSHWHYSPKLQRRSRCTAPETCRFSRGAKEQLNPNFAPITVKGYVTLSPKKYMKLSLTAPVIAPALKRFQELVSDEVFVLASESKTLRDGDGEYHMTVIAPGELRSLRKNGVNISAPQEEFTAVLQGVGSAANSVTQTWYGVMVSPEITHWRQTLGLPELDLHVTLGFTKTDIHGVSKGLDTLL